MNQAHKIHLMRKPALNDQFTATVRDLGTDGRGIVGHPSGQVFFVAGVWPGESGKFRITGFKQRFGFAQLIELLQPSPSRVAPPCSHHGLAERDCGGCAWQFIDYPAQLQAKEKRVRSALSRFAIDEKIGTIHASPHTLGYRNRAQFKTDGRQLGFVAAGSNRIAPIAGCPVLTPINQATLHALLGTLPEPGWHPQRKGTWTTLDVDEGITAEQIVPNQRRPFRQGNDAQNTFMREWLTTRLDTLDKARAVTELFAGSGNFTQVISAAGFQRIHAIEGVAASVAQLTGQKLHGVEGHCRNLFLEADCTRLQGDTAEASILVLDPPRDGFKYIAALLPKKHRYRDVFYASCDVATFTRDLQVLVDSGLEVQELQPLDLFPHTPHVELLCWLRADT